VLKHHDVETYGGVEVQRHTFLTSAVGGGEWLASSPDHFNPEERSPVPIGQEWSDIVLLCFPAIQYVAGTNERNWKGIWEKGGKIRKVKCKGERKVAKDKNAK
jgi:hypothetical protein